MSSWSGRTSGSPADAPSGAVVVSFRIVVQNASGITLALQSATLTGGVWTPEPPVIGSGVYPGEAPQYVNAAVQSFSGLGGTLMLVPATGGSITIAWTWPSGGAAAAQAVTQRTGIVVRGTLINPNTSEPTFQVVVGGV